MRASEPELLQAAQWAIWSRDTSPSSVLTSPSPGETSAATPCRRCGRTRSRREPPPPSPATSPAKSPRPSSPHCEKGHPLRQRVTDELLDNDAYLITTAMYNFSVPQQLKHWVDLIICDPRAADTNVPILSGRPALVVIAKGGAYGPGTPKEGLDHATPWLRTILESTWGLGLTVVELELTMAEHNPAMSDLVAVAQQLRTTAEANAVDWARTAVSFEPDTGSNVDRPAASDRRTT